MTSESRVKWKQKLKTPASFAWLMLVTLEKSSFKHIFQHFVQLQSDFYRFVKPHNMMPVRLSSVQLLTMHPVAQSNAQLSMEHSKCCHGTIDGKKSEETSEEWEQE